MEVVRKPYHFLKYRVWQNLRRAIDFRVARRELRRSGALPENERRLLAEVSLSTALDDGMYAGSAADYLRVGLSALRAIETALGESAKPIGDVRSILDFPSGYGRVLRFLKAKFPAAAITASEIDARALEFCRRVFSVRAVPSQASFGNLGDVGRFDLVWCGSLITHVDRRATVELLAFFRRQLRPGGVCVVTTHGPRSAQWIEDRTESYRLTPAAQHDLLAQFRGGGYGYVDYERRRGYGVSIISCERMREIAAGVGNWRNACYLEHGWAEHQDVYAFVADGGER